MSTSREKGKSQVAVVEDLEYSLTLMEWHLIYRSREAASEKEC